MSTLLTVYQQLFTLYGPQAWWPAETDFEVMVGAILTQNTAWANVEKAIINLKQQQYLQPEIIISLAHEPLAQCLKPSGYFNIKTARLQNFCRWYLTQGGYAKLNTLATAELRQRLLTVSGIGPETADDIMLYAFHRPVFVIDAYTRRLLTRLKLIIGNEDYDTLRGLMEKNLPPDVQLYKEYHALIVVHAKDKCRKRLTICNDCNLQGGCTLYQEHYSSDSLPIRK